MAPSLAETLFVDLAAACSATRRSFDRYVGMTQAQRQLLVVLQADHEITQAAVQRRLGVDGAAVTRLVKRLEAEGAVSRRLDPADNRYTLVSLTTAGEALVAELAAAHGAFQARLLAGVDRADQQIAVRVLEQIRANVRAVDDDTAAATATAAETGAPG
jgi:DNA-binding MarR family transcriptional regulator